MSAFEQASRDVRAASPFPCESINATTLRLTLPEIASFNQLNAVLGSCASVRTDQVHARAFFCSVSGGLRCTVRFSVPEPGGAHAKPAARKKRSREEFDAAADATEKAERAVEKLKASSKGQLPKSELETAQQVLTRLALLRSADGEAVVGAYGLFLKRLKPSDDRDHVVIAFRMHAGVSVSVHRLASAMGATWADGAVGTKETVLGIDASSLPLNAEGNAAVSLGNAHPIVVTAVPRSSTGN